MAGYVASSGSGLGVSRNLRTSFQGVRCRTFLKWLDLGRLCSPTESRRRPMPFNPALAGFLTSVVTLQLPSSWLYVIIQIEQLPFSH